jgi:hypothetical protein
MGYFMEEASSSTIPRLEIVLLRFGFLLSRIDYLFQWSQIIKEPVTNVI